MADIISSASASRRRPRGLITLLVVLSVSLLATFVAAAALVLVGSRAAGAQSNGGLTDPVVFVGGGWGHGAGMSQYGAYGRAAAGQSAAQILAAYYPNTSLQTVTPSADVRIRLAQTTGETTFRPPVGFAQAVVLDGTAIGSVTGTLDGSGLVRVRRGSVAPITVEGPGLVCPPGGCQGSDLVLPLTLDQPVTASATGDGYHRGRIHVLPDNGALLVLVDGLTMDEYLYGLAEMPSSWPAAALQAQAIAGRTYAQNRINTRRASGTNFDVYASTADQAYRGYSKEREAVYGARWVAAVDATSGQMVLYLGQPIIAFYSSSNGGHSESSGYVFSEDLPYLAVAPDPFDAHNNPNASWQRSYSVADLSRWLAARSDTDVGTLRAIRIDPPFGASGRVDRAQVTLVGSARTATVTGARFRTVVNAGVSADGGGLSRQLLSTKFTVPSVSYPPQGALDVVSQDGGQAVVGGWAVDLNSSTPITVHVYADGVFVGETTPQFDRDDVAALTGSSVPSGFVTRIALSPGTHRVCAYALNVGPPEVNPELGCRLITMRDRLPVGVIDVVGADATSVTFGGWTFDPDATDTSIQVHAWAGNRPLGAAVADTDRPDVAAFFRISPRHGFAARFPIPPDLDPNVPICLYAIDAGPGSSNPALGCRSLSQIERPPVGVIDVVSAETDSITFRGWTFDPNAPDTPLEVHAWMGPVGLGTAIADGNRPDVAAFFRVGANHGFDATFALPDELPPAVTPRTPICLYAINAGPGTGNPSLGCRSIAELDRRPEGALDLVAPDGAGGITVAGWAGDRDVPDRALTVHVYDNGTLVGSTTTGIARPDVAAARGLGPAHGFSLTVPVAPGSHRICAYALNAGPGTDNPELGCRVVAT